LMQVHPAILKTRAADARVLGSSQARLVQM
jgi:hypothetical protein